MTAAILRKMKKEEKGFTLIELLAVIVILGVIAAIAVPLISGIIKTSKEDSDVITARQIYDASRLYVTNELNGDYVSKTIYIENAATGAGQKGMKETGYLDKTLYLPSSKKEITTGSVKYDAQGALESVTLSTGSGTGDTVTFDDAKVLKAKN